MDDDVKVSSSAVITDDSSKVVEEKCQQIDKDTKDFEVADSKQKNEKLATYSTSIFLQKEMVATFTCIKCKNVPRNNPTTNESGDILCNICAKDFGGELFPTKGVQKMINNLKIICINNLELVDCKKDGLAEVEMNSIINNKCKWEGKLKEWEIHNLECEYAVIACEYCPQYTCIRRLMSDHLSDDCTHVIVECPLNCGQSMKKCEKESHVQNDCAEYILHCKNIGCDLQIKRQSIDTHMNSECDQRLVSCSFSKFGCIAGVQNNGEFLACELKQHLDENALEHLNLMLDFVMNQNTEMSEKQNARILQLEEDYKRMEMEIQELKAINVSHALPIMQVENKQREPIFKWKYSRKVNGNSNESVFEISDDGLKISVRKGKVYGSVMFGDWFSSETISKFTVHIQASRTKFVAGSIGFGFCTPEFEEWVSKKYHRGQNHSVVIYLSGSFDDSEEFEHGYGHGKRIPNLTPFLSKGEILAIELDMVSRVGRMWNYSIRKSHVKNSKVFHVRLPMKSKVGIICDAGPNVQSMKVVQQYYST